jgi:transcriptional regulator with XRE-family HTH domain
MVLPSRLQQQPPLRWYTLAVPSQPPDLRVQPIAQLLETLVRIKGFSLRELERRLGVSVGTARRIFSGAIAFKLSHILDILAILEVPPALFFRIAFEDLNPQALDEAEVLLAKAQKINLPPAKVGTGPEPVVDEQFIGLVEVALKRFGIIPVTPHKEESPRPPKKSAKATQNQQGNPRPPRTRRNVRTQQLLGRPRKP